MKKVQLIVLAFYATTCFAQTSKDSIGGNMTFGRGGFLGDNQLYNNRFQTPSLLKMNEFFRMEQFNQSLQTPTFNLSSLSFKDIPPINLTDNLHNQYTVNDWSWINTSRTTNNYYGLGGVYMVNANYSVKLGNSGVITGGVFASKYNIYNNFGNSTGLNGNLKIRLTDRISINTFGQYSLSGAKNGIPPYLSTMYPNSFYGGSIEFKVTDKWGIITGAQQEFDVFSRKWVTRPFIMPVFYGH